MGEGVSRGGLLGGIGLFLVGMMLFEDTIKEVGKGWLKHVLQRYTNTLGKSVGVGIVQTFLFQSSTIVTMITLGFVGAGIIGMYNGLGVILGANIGTTLTPWLVYLLGFKIHIEQYMLPLIGIGGLTLMIARPQNIWHKIAKFAVGFALLFLGLDYMKTSVEALATTIDLASYARRGVVGFTLIGALLTTIMQTSTGVTIIALTALSSGLITLDMALGIVIGANIGSALSTGMMGFLTSSHAQATKKQISMSHMIFNGSTALIVILGFQPLKQLIVSVVQADNPVLVLAVFHTVFNLILIMIWIPFLRQYTRLITSWFVDRNHTHQFAISQINTSISEEILKALQTDIGYLIATVINYNRAVMSPKGPDGSPQTLEMYATIKLGESTLLSSMALYQHDNSHDKKVFEAIDLYDDLLLDILASSKYLKDMIDHYESIYDADSNNGPLFYMSLHDMVHNIIDKVGDMLHHTYSDIAYKELSHAISHNLNDYHESFGTLLAHHTDPTTPPHFVSELVKTHHYTMLSCQRLVEATYRYKMSLDKKIR